MAIEFVCPACGGTLRVGDETAGRVIRCGGCMTALRAPAADAETGPSAPPSPYDDGRQYTPSEPPPPRVRPAPSARPEARPVASPRRRPDPDGDRPRERRSRRPPPPPAGKGVFFWLVVVGAVLLVGIVGCCGGFFLLLPDAKWQTHESKEGGFKVELPSKPQPDVVRAADLKLENGTRAEGAVLIKRGGARFVVIYRDIEPTKNRLKTDEQELDARVDRLQKGLEAEPLSSEGITVGGFSGREITFQSRKYGWHAARVVIADKRVYILLAGGGVALPGDPMVRRFLGSFEITEPELVKEGKRREEQAKLAADALEELKRRREEKANPPPRAEAPQKEGADNEAEDIGTAAKEVADMALGRAAQAARTAVAAQKLRGAAGDVAGIALDYAAQEAQAARDAHPVAPPLEVAPPPRPIGD